MKTPYATIVQCLFFLAFSTNAHANEVIYGPEAQALYEECIESVDVKIINGLANPDDIKLRKKIVKIAEYMLLEHEEAIDDRKAISKEIYHERLEFNDESCSRRQYIVAAERTVFSHRHDEIINQSVEGGNLTARSLEPEFKDFDHGWRYHNVARIMEQYQCTIE